MGFSTGDDHAHWVTVPDAHRHLAATVKVEGSATSRSKDTAQNPMPQEQAVGPAAKMSPVHTAVSGFHPWLRSQLSFLLTSTHRGNTDGSGAWVPVIHKDWT